MFVIETYRKVFIFSYLSKNLTKLILVFCKNTNYYRSSQNWRELATTRTKVSLISWFIRLQILIDSFFIKFIYLYLIRSSN